MPKKQIGRNVTVYVPDELAAKMTELKEVNWSQICQEAIQRYIQARKAPNPDVRVKIDQMKQDEEKDGYIFGSQLAAEIVKEMNYQELHELRWTALHEDEENWWFDAPSQITDWLDNTVNGYYDASLEERRKWRREFDKAAAKKGTINWVLKMAEKRKGLRKNKKFFDGMIKALRETLA